MNFESALRTPEVEEKPRNPYEIGRKVLSVVGAEEERERRALEKDMARARETFDREKSEQFMNERAQEIVEKKLNERLTTVDSLEEALLEEKPDIEKRSLEFNGKEIPVYDLKGLPFALLSHAIDYRAVNWDNPDHIGSQTSKSLLENPALWTETREEAERSEGYGTRSGKARGDVISTSFVNSESNLDTRVGANDRGHIHTCYGFSHLEGDSVLMISVGDGGTSNTGGKGRTLISKNNLNSVESLEHSSETVYNEIAIRRYSETGVPRKPDYLIAENGNITEDMLRHADFFGIPVLNIDRKVYDDRLFERGKALVESVDENSSYEEVETAIEDASRLAGFKGKIKLRESVGRKFDLVYSHAFSETDKKCEALAALEFEKRLDFLSKKLDEIISGYKSALETGAKYDTHEANLEIFSVTAIDVENETESSSFSDFRNPRYSVPGNPSFLSIEFREKGHKNIKTTIYDGKHPYKLDEALASGALKPEDLDAASSAEYNLLAPKAREYFSVYREYIAKNRKK